MSENRKAFDAMNQDVGDVTHTLRAGAGAGHESIPIAFSCKDHGADAAADLSPTLRAMGHKDSHMNGGGQVAVAFKPSHYTRDKDGAPSDIVPPLSADADKGDQEPLVFQTRFFTRDNKTGGAPGETADITNSHKAGDSAPVIGHQEYGVRRLTPRECERLQAWPDDHTAKRMKLKLVSNRWESAGKIEPQTDSPRYKQAGNGVTSSVSEWIANRINQFRA